LDFDLAPVGFLNDFPCQIAIISPLSLNINVFFLNF
jgi:hypothetical protein